MAKDIDTQMLINYGARGAGAIGLVQIANNFMPTIMANQWLSYGIYGITLGAILAASVGILITDQLLLK